MNGPIECGFYRTRSGLSVKIFEIGSFAYGRFIINGHEDLWTLDTGEYNVSDHSFANGHPLDLVERTGNRLQMGMR